MEGTTTFKNKRIRESLTKKVIPDKGGKVRSMDILWKECSR